MAPSDKEIREFYVSYTDEPHATRRKEIMAKYPKVKDMMGPDIRSKFIMMALVVMQIMLAYCLRSASIPVMLVCGYCLGGMINHSLTLAIHEIAHNLFIGHSKPLWNRIVGMIANFPIALPMSITFKAYHLDHHRYQGDRIIDTDIPTELEARLLSSLPGKLFFVTFMPLFYGLRPLFVYPKLPTFLDAVNYITQISFDALIFYFFGWRSLLYLLFSSFLGLGLHPMSGHFISEHYMFLKSHETYSYYGPINFFAWNVGYHNEHHDFPYVAGRLLPEVRRLAPEYYETLPHYSSWTRVLYDFVMDDNVSLYARIIRNKGLKDDELKN